MTSFIFPQIQNLRDSLLFPGDRELLSQINTLISLKTIAALLQETQKEDLH